MRVGILGGTFDPIHEGHITIANHVLKKLALDHIEFIPNYSPPHRKAVASAEDRLNMTTLALQSHSKLKINDIEIKNKKISYTVDTIEQLTLQKPAVTFYFILGADAFAQWDTWEGWQKILTLVHVVIVNREEHDAKIPEVVSDFINHHHLKNHLHAIEINPILISATKIREAFHCGDKKINGLCQAVLEYIVKKKLYSAK